MLRIFQSLLSWRLRQDDRGALPLGPVPCSRALRALSSIPPCKDGKAFRLPVFVWWTCAEYFAPAFPKSFLSMPARAASGGPTAERSPAFPASCPHALRALSSIPPHKDGKAFRLPVFVWWTCAEYFAPAFPKSFLSMPARAASGGPTAERSPAFPASCPHALRALSSIPPRKTGRPFAFPSLCGGPARNRTAVLQGSSADTTRLVCDQISPAGSPQTTCALGTLP